MADANLPALGLVTTLQNKVGTSLTGIQNLLPPPEANAAMVQAGSSAMSTSVLLGIKNDTEQMLDVSRNTAQYLKEMLGLDEEALRRQRENKAEALRESKKGGTPVGLPAGLDIDTDGDPKKKFDFGELSSKVTDILTLGLGAKLASNIAASGGGGAFAKSLGKSLLKRGVRGGIYGVIASAVAGPAIDYLDNEFKLELDEQSKSDIKNSITGVAAGAAIGGIPGAIIGGTLPMIANVAGYISGEMDSSEIKDYNWAGTAVGGTAAAMFTAAKLGGVMAGSTIPAVATLGAGIAALPVVIGVGAAVALGAGASFLSKKVDEYQEMTLKKLEKTTQDIDRDMGMWAAKQEAGLMERLGFGLGEQTALGEGKIASTEALEQFKQDPSKLDEKEKKDLISLVDSFKNMNDEALMTILSDNLKSGQVLSTIENLKAIAIGGGFGDQSKAITKSLFAVSDRIQTVSTNMLKEGMKVSSSAKFALDGRGQKGDLVEKAQEFNPQIQQQEIKIAQAEAKLKQAEADLKKFYDEGGKEGMVFSSDQLRAVESAQRELSTQQGVLNRILEQRDRFGSVGIHSYSYSDLEKLYANDPEGLKKLIEMSVNNSGAQFLQQQKMNMEQKQSTEGQGSVAVNSGNVEVKSEQHQKVDVHSGDNNVLPLNPMDYRVVNGGNPYI